MSKEDLTNDEFRQFLEMSREYVSDDASPWTRNLVESLIVQTETLSNSGREMTAKQLAISLITALVKIEQTARDGGVPGSSQRRDEV